MRLSVRLALSLALLAAASVVAVAATSYFQTSDRLHDELDAQLRADVQPLVPPADSRGLVAASLCAGLASDEPSFVSGYAARVSRIQGTSLQCIDANGVVTGWTGKVNLPLPASGSLDTSSRTIRSITFEEENFRSITIPGPDDGAIRLARSLMATEDVLASIRNRSALIGVAVIAIAALAGWLIARRVARPVARLTTAAEEVAATGRLEHDVPAGHDEIGRLARAFRTMLSALERSRAQQQQLVQDASHELRTPMTSLRTNLDTLRRHDDLDADVRDRVLADLDTELRELDTLTTELVELASETRSAEPDVEVALDELVEALAERTRKRTGRVVEVCAEPTTVMGRPETLARAIANLLDNATKFSPPDSVIEITVADGRVQIRDHGPGVPAVDLPHVFDRFYRAVDARSLPGSGLGLSIVRSIVEANGGHVDAENCADGGAAFTVELPVVTPT